jgi:hypothetical protein
MGGANAKSEKRGDDEVQSPAHGDIIRLRR